ncbi:coiled-coil-helix-coiled-coil-helix domain-containing protein 5 isoform X3 [Emydura macquarii macquarii]|uniref:coiled-coil-helix-coiled-coil-helix domain-containing protein 5 isoform X3 n=1 Tax=Emydura macquarii macquarii TaxID=1129001 RepID=UPI00352B81EB
MRVGRPGPARRRVCCFRVAARARPRDRPRGSMQAALEVAARHCRSETEQYGRCVAASPSTWQRDCHQLKLSMARCTSAHPIVQKIRRDCAEPFTAFEQCLKQNEASVMNCTEHVEQFLLCAEQVKLVTKGDTENFRLQE